MLSNTPLQGRQSSMWAVMVLGIISAVFAWIWFGGRGEKKTSEKITHRHDSVPETGSKGLEKDSQVTPLTSEEGNTEDLDIQEPSPGNTQHDITPYNEEVQTSLANLTEKGPELVEISEDLEAHQEEFEQTRADINFSPGLEKPGLLLNGDLSPSVVTDELVGAREEVYPFVDEERVQLTVEEMKPSFVTVEKLVQTNEVNDFSVPDKVVPTSAEIVTDLVHLVQDDSVKLINGSEEHVQQDTVTVCFQGNFTNGNILNVTASPKQVDKSASENFDHDKHEFYEQSGMDLAVDKKPSATLESTASAQCNDHIAQITSASTETGHAEVLVPQKCEDLTLTSHTPPTVDKGIVLLHSSNQEEENPDLKWSSSSDNSSFATQSEAKLYEIDTLRTKKVAAVQPIPHNATLCFKVHYNTHSNSQIIAVIGDHEKLGEWESYVPLTSDKDGYWSHSVTLPADASIEWKFVMVENGKIKRWEECNNRHLRTAHEDIGTQQWWGYP